MALGFWNFRLTTVARRCQRFGSMTRQIAVSKIRARMHGLFALVLAGANVMATE